MNESFTSFHNIQSISDLLLIDQPTDNGAVIHFDHAPFYAEICLWVTIRCSEFDLFANESQTLVDATTRDGYGWRLSLSPHGYLRFEDQNPDPKERQCIDSHIPVHAVVDTATSFRVGLCMSSGAWLYRATPYVGAKGSARLRLFAMSGTSRRLSEIGGEDNIDRQSMNPTPETMTVGADATGGHLFSGQIERLTAYNSSRLELFDATDRLSARDALPLMPAGSSFEPRWVDGETIEVFTRPDFVSTDAFWVCLDLNMLPSACRRLRLWTTWSPSGTVMCTRFFHNTNGAEWTRVIPSRVDLRAGDGRNFQVEFDVDGPLKQGGVLAICPPFTEADRESLLSWAGEQKDITMTRIGESVEGRAIHIIKLGRGVEVSGRRGVAIICGQHSPLEIMGGRVIRPLIEQLLLHPFLLDLCNFYIVPTVNVDCQHYGGNGFNMHQRNPNRHWMVNLEPETRACVEYFDSLKSAGQRIDFAMDIHAGAVFRNHQLWQMGASDTVPLSPEQIRQQEPWVEAFERHAGLRRVDGIVNPQQNLRATDYCHQVHGSMAFVLELSTCSYFDPIQQCSRPFDTEAFNILAKGLIQTWDELWHI